jgi:hypothetical protein
MVWDGREVTAEQTLVDMLAMMARAGRSGPPSTAIAGWKYRSFARIRAG